MSVPDPATAWRRIGAAHIQVQTAPYTEGFQGGPNTRPDEKVAFVGIDFPEISTSRSVFFARRMVHPGGHVPRFAAPAYRTATLRSRLTVQVPADRPSWV
jgi:hypothetical protein